MMELACPGCSARFSFEPVTVITPDSEHLDDLLAGTLNCVECPQCGKRLNIPVQLLYRDVEDPCMIVQGSARSNPAELAAKLDESATDAACQTGTVRPKVRLVFARPEFIEKIHLHRSGMDDRLIEFAKYQLFNGGAGDAIDPKEHRLLYDFSQSDDDKLSFIVFNRGTGRPVRVLQVPMEEFRKLEEEVAVNPAILQELERVFPGCRVDVDNIFADAAKVRADEEAKSE
ncbi:MAG: hypothetical protein J6S21_01465 [Victivallales bacterium]|nr:hypothetical protein [Victivallales bacterium]